MHGPELAIVIKKQLSVTHLTETCSPENADFDAIRKWIVYSVLADCPKYPTIVGLKFQAVAFEVYQFVICP
jgi:hypothetical protein